MPRDRSTTYQCRWTSAQPKYRPDKGGGIIKMREDPTEADTEATVGTTKGSQGPMWPKPTTGTTLVL